MYIHIYIYICTYIYLHTFNIYTFTFSHTHIIQISRRATWIREKATSTYIHMYIDKDMHKKVCRYRHIYRYTYIHIYRYIYICVCIYIYLYIHIYIYKHIYIYMLITYVYVCVLYICIFVSRRATWIREKATSTVSALSLECMAAKMSSSTAAPVAFMPRTAAFPAHLSPLNSETLQYDLKISEFTQYDDIPMTTTDCCVEVIHFFGENSLIHLSRV